VSGGEVGVLHPGPKVLPRVPAGNPQGAVPVVVGSQQLEALEPLGLLQSWHHHAERIQKRRCG